MLNVDENHTCETDDWQDLVFSMYHAHDFREGDFRSPFQKVMESATKLFPPIELTVGKEQKEEEWHRYVLGSFVWFLRQELGLAPAT